MINCRLLTKSSSLVGAAFSVAGPADGGRYYEGYPEEKCSVAQKSPKLASAPHLSGMYDKRALIINDH